MSSATSERSLASPRSSADDRVERAPHATRRRRLARVRESARSRRARVAALARLRKLHADDAALAPRDAAAADRRVEECKTLSRHHPPATLTTPRGRNLEDLAVHLPRRDSPGDGPVSRTVAGRHISLAHHGQVQLAVQRPGQSVSSVPSHCSGPSVTLSPHTEHTQVVAHRPGHAVSSVPSHTSLP